jgi:hypothetical protein
MVPGVHWAGVWVVKQPLLSSGREALTFSLVSFPKLGLAISQLSALFPPPQQSCWSLWLQFGKVSLGGCGSRSSRLLCTAHHSPAPPGRVLSVIRNGLKSCLDPWVCSWQSQPGAMVYGDSASGCSPWSYGWNPRFQFWFPSAVSHQLCDLGQISSQL